MYRSIKYIVILLISVCLFTPTLFSKEKNIFRSTPFDLGESISAKKNRSFPEFISGSDSFNHIYVSKECSSFFVKIDQLIIKDANDNSHPDFISKTSQKILVRKLNLWRDMMFEVYPVDPNYYSVEYRQSKNGSSTQLDGVVYIPLSTQYAITPEAFSKRLYTKRRGGLGNIRYAMRDF